MKHFFGCTQAFLFGSVVVIHIFTLLTQNINWDEFHYLAEIYKFKNGEITSALQTIHVRFFGWLHLVSDNEVDQIIAARVVMLIFHLGVGACIYQISNSVTNRPSATAATCAYFICSFSITSGASFRYDPTAAFLIMAALVTGFRKRLSAKHILLISLTTSLALLVTLKSIFFVPTILLSILFKRKNKLFNIKDAQNTVLVILAIPIIVFLGAYLHGIGMVSTREPAVLAEAAAKKTLMHAQFFPRLNTFLFFIESNLPVFFLFLLGIYSFLKKYNGDFPKLSICGLLLPLTCLLVYRNAYAYFYPFLVAPAMIFVAFGWNRLVEIFNRVKWLSNPTHIGILILTIQLLIFGVLAPSKNVTANDQKKLLAEIHKIFPEPVTYIDRCSMLSTHSKVGFFMSTWGESNYNDRGLPIFDDIIESEQPKFLLANKISLDIDSFENLEYKNNTFQWLDADKAALAQNFVHHWGPLYVAGKAIVTKPGQTEHNFLVKIPGTYTLEINRPVKITINGEAYKAGDVLELNIGEHVLKSPESLQVVLRWGEHLPVPTVAYELNSIFTGF